ncbi:MAG TPA: IS200/IS605 family transposase, partial [Candidatus Latescibacteria bacterium]|nr:IS200/IS605 family transposase [Candidatus Latescibacterota bacterium]
DQVLNDDIALRTRSLIREICAIHEAKISRGVVAPDYVQIEVVCPPTLTPSALVNDLKERTLNALQEQFPDLKQQYWGLPLWSGGYMCVTTGDDAETQLNEYLEGKKPADDESFQLIPAP